MFLLMNPEHLKDALTVFRFNSRSNPVVQIVMIS